MSAQVPRIVVIGTGKLAKIHLAYLASIFPIYAIVDSTLSRSKSSEFQAANYWTYEEYLQRVDFDIVVIVSRDSYHFDHAKHGLASSKIVFCEKPVALSLAQTIDLFDVADLNNGILVAGFQRRFDPPFVNLKEKIAEIGNLEIVRIVSRDYAQFSVDPCENKIETIKRMRQFVFNSMIHDFDAYAYYTGDVEARVLHSTSSYSASTSLPFSAAAVIESKEGVIGVLELGKCNNYGYDQRAELFGELGCLSVENCEYIWKRDNEGFRSISDSKKIADTHKCWSTRYKDAYNREMEFILDLWHFREGRSSERFESVLLQVWGVKPDLNGILGASRSQCVSAARLAEETCTLLAVNLQEFKAERIEDAEVSIPLTSPSTNLGGCARKEKINVVLVGAGRMGKIRADTFKLLKAHCQVNHVVDSHLPSAGSLAESLVSTASSDLAIALSSNDVDVVWIAVGTIFHLDIIKQCASSKGRIRAIYCEKPISTTVEEVEEAFRVATEAGILLHACWNRRQDPFIQSACQKVGKGLSASFIFGDNPVPPQESLGSLFHDCTCHDIDILLSQIAGPQSLPISVFGTGTSCVSYIKDSLDTYLQARKDGTATGPPPLDTVVGVITLDSGMVVTFITRRRSCFGYDQRLEAVYMTKDEKISVVSTRNCSREEIAKEYQANIGGTVSSGKKEVSSDGSDGETGPICYSFDTRYASSMYNEVLGMVSAFNDVSVDIVEGNEKRRKENVLTSSIADQLLESYLSRYA